jgi:gliding motility-associated-like protein
VIVNEDLIFYVPNTFTPDGDEFNQEFHPVFTAGFDPFDFNMIIFNRWGEIVFESNNAAAGWDGTYHGKLVQDGTYTWKIEYKLLLNDSRQTAIGHVTILK